jgi:hypothetical protein
MYQGLGVRGTDILVAGPAQVAPRRPDAVLRFVPDLLAEVQAAFPKWRPPTAGGRMLRRSAYDARSRHAPGSHRAGSTKQTRHFPRPAKVRPRMGDA